MIRDGGLFRVGKRQSNFMVSIRFAELVAKCGGASAPLLQAAAPQSNQDLISSSARKLRRVMEEQPKEATAALMNFL